jgi:hypothetical protein
MSAAVVISRGKSVGRRVIGVAPLGHDRVMELCDVATEQLEAELVAHAAWESRGLARFLDVLVEYDRRQAWGSWGRVSVQHWVSWKCGLASVAASERLRVAKALQELPLVKQALWDGHLSYSKVRELTRVVAPETEERWCEVARHLTAGQLAKLVAAGRRARGSEPARRLVGSADGSPVRGGNRPGWLTGSPFPAGNQHGTDAPRVAERLAPVSCRVVVVHGRRPRHARRRHRAEPPRLTGLVTPGRT